ncbi:helix-turn-helix domain-containing protein [Paenibacillus sepulcri]
MITIRPERLKPYVDKIVWQGGGTGEPFTVYPDIYHVMGFQTVGRVMLVSGGHTRPLAPAGLTGLHKETRIFQTTAHLSSVLVYFKPEALFRMRNYSSREIANQSVGLTDLGGSMSDWERLMQAPMEPRELLCSVEAMVWEWCRVLEIDTWANWAVERIRASHGLIRIEEIAEESTVSRRQFERRFVERVGVPPKSFAQIVKFQHVLQSMGTAETLTNLAHDAGYFDQSHLIKHIRGMSGLSPGDVRRLLAWPAAED